MNSGTHFDIFTDSPDAQPMWIESTQNLEDARERLREVARIAPQRDCFVYSEESGIVEIVLRANFQAQESIFTDGDARQRSVLSKFPRRPMGTPSSQR